MRKVLIAMISLLLGVHSFPFEDDICIKLGDFMFPQRCMNDYCINEAFDEHLAPFVRFMDKIASMIIMIESQGNDTIQLPDILLVDAISTAFAVSRMADGGATFHHICKGEKKLFLVNFHLDAVQFNVINSSAVEMTVGYENNHPDMQRCFQEHIMQLEEQFTAQTSAGTSVQFVFADEDNNRRRLFGALLSVVQVGIRIYQASN